MKKILLSAIVFLLFSFFNTQKVNAIFCGLVKDDGSGNQICVDENNIEIGGGVTCPRNSTVCCTPIADCESVFPIEDIVAGPSNQFFDMLNPLVQNGTPGVSDQLKTPGGIVSRILQFLFPLAGLVLFVMLIWGGFEILAKSAEGTKGIEAGKNRITAAVVGFLLLFATYWMAQIIEAVFGIVIV